MILSERLAPSFRGNAKALNYDVQLHIGESRSNFHYIEIPDQPLRGCPE
jgi:hypothetical protein